MGAASSRLVEGPSSVVVAPASGSSGAVHRSPRSPDKLLRTAYEPAAGEPGVLTLYDAFQRGLRVSADRPVFGTRESLPAMAPAAPDAAASDDKQAALLPPVAAPASQAVFGEYEWLSYQAANERITHLGSGLLHLGLVPAAAEGHRFLGIFSKNRAEWSLTQNACAAYSLVDVALYDTLGEEAVLFILGQTGLATIATDAAGAQQLLKWKTAAPASCTTLVSVVQFGDVAAGARARFASNGLRLLSFEEVVAAGAAHPLAHVPPKANDLAFLCYTSGTTGMPKGAMIKHGNIIALSSCAESELGFNREELHLSYLPLAHIFERIVQAAVLMAGGAIGFYQGDTKKLSEDLVALRPTLFCSVPRLYNVFYDKIMGGVRAKGGIAEALFNVALTAKVHNLHAHNVQTHTLWDPIAFAGVRKRLGLDRCRIMATGSAPIAANVLDFLRVVFGAKIVEGYGQTECMGVATLTRLADQTRGGHVGGPLTCNEVKLVSVEELGFKIDDTVHDDGSVCAGRGEVCYRGHNVFPGYFRDPERTAEALDAEGWLHSGDVGLWDSNGNLRIFDRKKNIFKLAQGEYIAPEKIEVVCKKSALVAAVFVHGDSLQSSLVCVMCPDPDGLKAFAESKGIAGDLAALCRDPVCKAHVLQQVTEVCRADGLHGFEIPRAAFLEPTPWAPGEALMTPSFKLKRAEAKKHYAGEIAAMYAAMKPSA